MNSNLPTTLDIGAFLVTYALHSTVLLAGVTLVVRWLRPPWPEVRELLWKAALIGGVLTSLTASWLPVQHWGWEVCLAMSTSDGDKARVTERVATPTATAPELAPPEFLFEMSSETEAPSTVVGAAGRASEPAVGAIPGPRATLWPALVGVWLMGCGLGALRLTWQWLELRRFERRCRRLTAGPLVERAQALARRLGTRRRVEVYLSPLGGGPMAAGLFRWRLYLPAKFLRRLDPEQREALLAHELAHLVRGDSWWILLGQLTCLVFFFQPLNFLARRQLRTEAEYLADDRAAAVLADGLPLARCLMELGQWLLAGRRFSPHPVAASMMPYRSALGRRVEQLLCEERPARRRGQWQQKFYRIGLILTLTLTLIGAPRALAERQSGRDRLEGDPPMKRFENLKSVAWSLAIALGLTAPAVAGDEKKPDGDKKPAAEKPVQDGKKKESVDGKKPAAEALKDGAKKKGVGERDPDLFGKITAVAADGKSITLEVPAKKDGGKDMVVKIYLTGETKLAPASEASPKLEPGQAAKVWLTRGSQDIAAGVAFGVAGKKDTGIKGKAEQKPDLIGKITAITDDGKTLTVAVPGKGEKFKEATVKLTLLTKVQSAGDEKSADKPAVGNLITVWLQEGTQEIAVRVRLAGQDKDKESLKKKIKEGADKKADLTGKVTAVSDDGKQLTLELPRKDKGAEPATQTVRLTDKTKLEYLGVEKDAQKPAVGQLAQVQLEEGSKDAAASVTLAVKSGKDGVKKPVPEKKKETKKPVEAK